MTASGLRADARRNRDQLVAAALKLFLDEGIDVPLEEVARVAGVGIGTLYRRFPDRDALIRATAYEALRQLAELAEAAWREEPDAWHALARFLRSCAELRLGALQAAVEPRLHAAIRTAPELRDVRQVVVDLVAKMTMAAQEEGALRRDVGPADVGLLMSLQVYAPPDLPRDQAMSRVVDIMLAGLRAETPPVSEARSR
ncbi:MAG TPA: helix-turn-helix domain-containing protein [Kribbella sp.]|nr:helix-turn-helix domain-containing protein [Kribbella sp.]